MTDKELDDIASFAFAVFAAMLFGGVLAVAMVYATMVAWGMVMPQVFGLPELSLKNAVGLVGLGWLVRCAVPARRSEKWPG